MAVLEVKVNGERRFRGEDVTAVTLACDRVGRRDVERIAMHVGTGGPGERDTHFLATNLVPGDEITIRVLEDAELAEHAYPPPDACSFCGSSFHDVQSLVAAQQKAICDACLSCFGAVVLKGAPLPVGAAIRETAGGPTCAFCEKGPPDVPAVFVRNDSAICPGCLRACADLRQPTG
jgi:hypothetical protein